MKHLRVANLGPLREANVTFGDLTILVGPQASGKSLFLQTYKALSDGRFIREDLKSYGFDWTRSKDAVAEFCASYFGGGMEGIVRAKTVLERDGRAVQARNFYNGGGEAESVYLIPAQRVLMLQDGWPRPFMSYPLSDPYSIKHFSESVRRLMERGLGQAEALFPQPKRLKADLKAQIAESIYTGGTLNLEAEGAKRRIVLRRGRGSSLTQGAWSAGQREFTPLLLGLYWLMPSTRKSRQGGIETVIIEEPEMGLHPRAIVGFGLLVLELLHREYRVVISTHSPVILDLVWALRTLGSEDVTEKAKRNALHEIFFKQRPMSAPIKELYDAGLGADIRTYFFHRGAQGVVTKDISSLDPGSDDADVSGWGGLSGFSGDIAEAIGKATGA